RTLNFGLRAALLISAVFAISVLLEREAEPAQKRTALVVVGGGRDHGDAHPANAIDLVLVDLVEHRLFGQTEGVVAVSVELLRGQPTEVADAGQSEAQRAVQELPHAPPAQGDVRADRLALAQLELGDGLARPVHRRLLAGDVGQVADGPVDHLGVACGIAHTHVHHYLDQAGHLVDVLVVELLPQGGQDLLAVLALQPRQLRGLFNCCAAHHTSLPERLATRTRAVLDRPSRSTSSVRYPTRVPFLVSGSTSITLLTWIGASMVSIPPLVAPRWVWETLVWRCMRCTPSTSTRSVSVRTSSTRPCWPLSRPEMTTTRSPFLIFAMVTAPPVRARRC